MQQVDDPPYLSVGTEVSAKYKGAFCEAKVRKVVRNIKCKIAYKQGPGSATVSDDQIKAGHTLRVGAMVEVKHPEKREYVEASITKIQDCSQYTVVFDDGDITTLRRSALCLKSGRHFNESETLDQLPLTHPEHFGNPVMGGRRGRSNFRRSRQMQEDSSEEEDEPDTTKAIIIEKEEHIGKVVCVESTDTKKKGPKENWFPGLVVAPTAQDTVRIRVKDDYLVRSFKDGRYYTVPKKEATEFTRELAPRQEGAAVAAALEYLDANTLPAHWDRDTLFGISASSSDYEQEFDSDTSDDEPREEKDHFVAQLYKYMDDRGTPLNKVPSIINKDVDLYRLFRAVHKLGGYNRVTSQNQWKAIAVRLGFAQATASITNLVKQAYKKFLQPFEDFNRKLGCTMVAHPRANRIKGRSLVRTNSVASPKPNDSKEMLLKSSLSASTTAEESENTSESSTEPTKTVKRKITTAVVATIAATSSAGTSGKVKMLVDKFEEKIKEEPISSEQQVTGVAQVIQPSPAQISARIAKPVIPAVAIPAMLIPKEEPPPTPPAIVAHPSPTATVKREPKTVKTTAVKAEDRRGRKRKEPPDVEKPEKMIKKEIEPIAATSTPNTSTSGTVPPAVVTGSNDFPIVVGDKLKVYYHEQKVTYEAKVIEIATQQGAPMYLVHYTGWNTRYDEWVPKDRIAENLTTTKSKRGKANNATKQNALGANSGGGNFAFGSATAPNSGKTGGKRGRGGSRSDSQPPRSTTPSSIASNSSRTKSPATPAQRRTTRGQPNTLRRTSNNTDISSVQTESDTDSDEPVKRAPSTRISGIASQPATPKASDSHTDMGTPITRKKRISLDDEEKPPKGRDFDLKQIRNELKGFTEIKSPSPDAETQQQQAISSSSSSSTSVTAAATSSIVDNVTKTTSLFDLSDTSNSAASLETKPPHPSDNAKNKSSGVKSMDVSSDADSFGDDDSQSSDQIMSAILKVADKVSTTNSTAIATATTNAHDKDTPKDKPLFQEKKEDKGSPSSAKKASNTDRLSAFKSTAMEREPEEKVEPVRKSEKTPVKGPTLVAEKTTPVKLERKLILEKARAKSPHPDVKTESDKVGGLLKSADKFSAAAADVYEFKEPEPFELETSAPAPASSVRKLPPPTAISPEVDKPKRTKATKQAPELPAESTPIVSGPPETVEKPTKRGKPPRSTDPTDLAILTPTKKAKRSPAKETDKNKTALAAAAAAAAVAAAAAAAAVVAAAAATTTTLTTTTTTTMITTTTTATTTITTTPSTTAATATTAISTSTSTSTSTSIAATTVTNTTSSTASNTVAFKRDEEISLLSNFAQLVPPQKSSFESTFDVLRKSPNFNMVTNQPHDDSPPSMLPFPTTALLPPPPIIDEKPSEPAPAIKRPTALTLLPFSEPETKPANTKEIFKGPEEEPDSERDRETGHNLETIEKMLLCDEPSTFDDLDEISEKPSIADKVLKALSSAKSPQNVEVTAIVEATPIVVVVPQDPVPIIVESSVSVKSPIVVAPIESEPIVIAIPSLIEMPPNSAILELVDGPSSSSAATTLELAASHKMLILEPTASKHNDLSVTIQKLESAIQKNTQLDRFGEDSLDSTDSEQRLIIEDESQSSETNLSQTEFISLIKKESDLSYGNGRKEPMVAPVTVAVAVTRVDKEPDGEIKVPLLVPKPDAEPEIGDVDTQETAIKIEDQQAAAQQAAAESISLLCEETIPGSPASVCPSIGGGSVKEITENLKRGWTDGLPAYVSSHPTTSDVKPVPMDLEPNETPTDATTITLPPETVSPVKAERTPSISPRDSLSHDDSKSDSEDHKKNEQNADPSTKKRRRNRKISENELQHKRRKAAAATVRKSQTSIGAGGSDSDDNSDANASTQRASTSSGSVRHSPKPSPYNFLVQLDPVLTSNQRITMLKKKIQELRKTYNMIKAELASIDRRRKKLRRREREIKKNQLKATVS